LAVVAEDPDEQIQRSREKASLSGNADRLLLARARLGGLFRVEDYPTSKEIRDKFSFDIKVMHCLAPTIFA
jgi:hypothetical protein